MRGFSYFRDSIAHGNGETDAAHHGDIRKIIADKGNSRIGDASFLNDFFISRHLYGLLHVDKFHPHFVGSAEERGTFKAGNTSGTQACGLRQSEALVIMCVKRF